MFRRSQPVFADKPWNLRNPYACLFHYRLTVHQIDARRQSVDVGGRVGNLRAVHGEHALLPGESAADAVVVELIYLIDARGASVALFVDAAEADLMNYASSAFFKIGKKRKEIARFLSMVFEAYFPGGEGFVYKKMPGAKDLLIKRDTLFRNIQKQQDNVPCNWTIFLFCELKTIKFQPQNHFFKNKHYFCHNIIYK